MRCAAIHRKLGTHISKVKSLSMDTWTDEQVDVSQSDADSDKKSTGTIELTGRLFFASSGCRA